MDERKYTLPDTSRAGLRRLETDLDRILREYRERAQTAEGVVRETPAIGEGLHKDYFTNPTLLEPNTVTGFDIGNIFPQFKRRNIDKVRKPLEINNYHNPEKPPKILETSEADSGLEAFYAKKRKTYPSLNDEYDSIVPFHSVNSVNIPTKTPGQELNWQNISGRLATTVYFDPFTETYMVRDGITGEVTEFITPQFIASPEPKVEKPEDQQD